MERQCVSLFLFKNHTYLLLVLYIPNKRMRTFDLIMIYSSVPFLESTDIWFDIEIRLFNLYCLFVNHYSVVRSYFVEFLIIPIRFLFSLKSPICARNKKKLTYILILSAKIFDLQSNWKTCHNSFGISSVQGDFFNSFRLSLLLDINKYFSGIKSIM